MAALRVVRGLAPQSGDEGAESPSPRMLAAIAQLGELTFSSRQLEAAHAELSRWAPEMARTMLVMKCRNIGQAFSPAALLETIRPLIADGPPGLEVEYGVALLRLGRFDEAEAPLYRAWQAEPEQFYHQIQLGQLRLCQDRLNEAESMFERSRILAPDCEAPYCCLALVALAHGMPDLAETWLAEAGARDHGVFYHNSWLSLARGWLGQMDESLDLAERACATAHLPGKGWVLSNKALAQLWAGQVDAAIASQQQMLSQGRTGLAYLDGIRPFARQQLALLTAAADGDACTIEALRSSPSAPERVSRARS